VTLLLFVMKMGRDGSAKVGSEGRVGVGSKDFCYISEGLRMLTGVKQHKIDA
jgi:hypothetical protein